MPFYLPFAFLFLSGSPLRGLREEVVVVVAVAGAVVADTS
jgi:hypothetical protein